MNGTVLLSILVSQAIGGLASILTKLALGGLEPWTMVFLRQLIGGAILFVMWRLSRQRSQPVPVQPFTGREIALLCTAAWGGFALPQVLLAFLATAVGTWTWNYAPQHISASTLGTFVFLQPIVGPAAGVLFLGESVGTLALAGTALITAGVILETRSSASSEPKPPGDT